MTASWALVTAPTSEPINLTEAKAHAKITQDNDDATLQRFIRTSREAAEEYMARGLLTQTWQLALDGFHDEMWLPMAAPLQSVTTVQYYDIDGALQTLSASNYTLDIVSQPGRILLAADAFWPSLQSNRFAPRVVITYVVGWANPAQVPERIKQGIRLYVAYCDCDREGLEEYGQRAKAAAEACWTDRVRWIEPC